MAKQDAAKGDLFGMDDDEGGDEYVIVQLIGAEGWRAVFNDGKNPQRVLGLACFALVEIIPENPNVAQIPQRAIRPMVVDEFGDVEDVATFGDFICVVQPGIAIEPVIAYAIKQRETAK